MQICRNFFRAYLPQLRSKGEIRNLPFSLLTNPASAEYNKLSLTRTHFQQKGENEHG